MGFWSSHDDKAIRFNMLSDVDERLSASGSVMGYDRDHLVREGRLVITPSSPPRKLQKSQRTYSADFVLHRPSRASPLGPGHTSSSHSSSSHHSAPMYPHRRTNSHPDITSIIGRSGSHHGLSGSPTPSHMSGSRNVVGRLYTENMELKEVLTIEKAQHSRTVQALVQAQAQFDALSDRLHQLELALLQKNASRSWWRRR